MPALLRTIVAIALVSAAASAGATSTSSAASDSLGTSSVGSSNSIANSSNNSSGGNKTAAGDYRVTDVAVAPDRPDAVRYTLEGTSDRQGKTPIYLYVPREVAQKTALVAGNMVHARQRPYGVEFSDNRDRKAFFLVLDDPWYRELKIRPVAL